MFLKNLVLFNFKSYEDHSFVFPKGINSLVGKNGSGKTNVLEAIYFACITKSFSGLKDQQLIKHEEQCFVINAKIDDLELVASIKEDQRKQILLNKKAYEKLSEAKEDAAEFISDIKEETAEKFAEGKENGKILQEEG